MELTATYKSPVGDNFMTQFTKQPLGCGHIGVHYSGIRCTFLRTREFLKSNIISSL